MVAWSSKPVIYEINTWVWLHELSRRYGRAVSLATVPAEEWDAIGAAGFDSVWLMGVWERSPLGTAVANGTTAMVDEFCRVLPNYTTSDNVGSPYCVRRYVVDAQLGGPEALAAARDALRARGLRLILDYVPNHVALDHPWVKEHPEYFIRGDRADLERDPDGYFEVEGRIIARGRDPNFPAWPDVAQLNAFSWEFRSAVAEVVSSIADQCDGMRCDMAMLMMTDIFRRTWGDRGGDAPSKEFWPELMEAVRRRHPDVLFIAEAYWDLEFSLQQQGFDYCYDKRLYDRLLHETPDSIRDHLRAGLDYQGRLLRFIENHDEPRASAVFTPMERQEAAAVVTSTLPGASLFHEGQFEGKRTRIPVFLGRGPIEQESPELKKFYAKLLRAMAKSGKDEASWRLCETHGWPDNQSCRNLLAWTWKAGDERALVVVNYSDQPAQGLLQPDWPDFGEDEWLLEDPLAGRTLERDGHEIQSNGLYVDLPAWGRHYFIVSNPAVISAPARTLEPARAGV